jgi:hypothetical protein
MFDTAIHPSRVAHQTESLLMVRSSVCLTILGLSFLMLIGLAGTAMAAAAPTPAPAAISPEKCREGGGVVEKTPYAFICRGGNYDGADVEY